MEALLSYQDAERIENIAKINASYILDTLPHRLYAHPGGDIFEITVQLIDTSSGEMRRGIIGVRHQSVLTEEDSVRTYILYEDGTTYGYDISLGKLPYGIRRAHHYMLLGPTDIGDWILQGSLDKEKSHKIKREIGIELEDIITGNRGYLSYEMAKVREVYRAIV